MSRSLPAATVVCAVCFRGFAGGGGAGAGRVMERISCRYLQELSLDLGLAQTIILPALLGFPCWFWFFSSPGPVRHPSSLLPFVALQEPEPCIALGSEAAAEWGGRLRDDYAD